MPVTIVPIFAKSSSFVVTAGPASRSGTGSTNLVSNPGLVEALKIPLLPSDNEPQKMISPLLLRRGSLTDRNVAPPGAGSFTLTTLVTPPLELKKRMSELLKRGLEEENHSVSLAYDGTTALELAELYEFDAIVLDIMLPGLDGYEVARRLRRARNQTPILVLTARDAVPDVVKGLDVGADDYLTKPFAFEELLARLRSVARRGSSPRPTSLQAADLTLDPATRQVMRGNREIHLSPTEYRLLEFLMRRRSRVVSRDAIVQAVWGFSEEVEENTLDAFIRLLRSKVDRDFNQKLIHTVRGVGYTIREGSKA